MARHDAESYFLHRPLYPAALFRRAIESVPWAGRATSHQRPVCLADIGCGTGQSVRSWLSALEGAVTPGSVEIDALDSDPAMIERARASDWNPARVRWRVATGEATGLAPGSQDIVSVLSAYHWFERASADAELARILRPGGVLLVAEYQFPTAAALPELNEWIRRSFNQCWKFAEQKPRGSLKELVTGLSFHPLLEEPVLEKIPMKLVLSADEVAGLLLSQARVIAWLSRERGEDRAREADLKTALREGVRSRMPSLSAEFDFRLSAFSARRRKGL